MIFIWLYEGHRLWKKKFFFVFFIEFYVYQFFSHRKEKENLWSVFQRNRSRTVHNKRSKRDIFFCIGPQNWKKLNPIEHAKGWISVIFFIFSSFVSHIFLTTQQCRHLQNLVYFDNKFWATSVEGFKK